MLSMSPAKAAKQGRPIGGSLLVSYSPRTLMGSLWLPEYRPAEVPAPAGQFFLDRWRLKSTAHDRGKVAAPCRVASAGMFLPPRQYLKGSQSMQNIPGTDPAAFLSYALVTELIDTLMSQGVMSSVEVNNMLHRILSTIGTMNRGASNEAADILREWIKRNPAK